ncbi:Com family DNA-binding transcriptional regulator [Marinomonas shanghaiensis]|uniref:Com family DNA-binding transcriptional regulator n=1 Tax=Marinomonas shanghaiensis TaxID=2202418 RepID=UPI000DB93535|nr:Com family DNA-binding transcriptional regulator [Marinomonas shanghaiensis]
MQNIRCSKCNKLLAKGVFQMIEIKCPRCKHINESAMSTINGVKPHGKTHHSMDRRQA